MHIAGPVSPHPISSYQTEPAEEVLLTFRYRGVGNVYVTGLYDNATMYLPVMEIFDLLDINYVSSIGDFSIGGTYLSGDNPYRILFSQFKLILGSKEFNYSPDEFRIGELDYYLSPKVFEEAFGLFFSVNLNNLSLALETDKMMPIEERMERERARERMEARDVTRAYYPLEYGRNRRVFGMGFADYSISGNFTGEDPNTNYSVTGGLELFGGDVQGNLIGLYLNNEHTIKTSNLRWRYVVRDNSYFSTFSAGQLGTTGLMSRPLVGASISNNPIEPRRIFEAYVIDGNTEPDSEVELYLNNRLIDYQRADEAGYYRFEFPLTYGTSRVSITVYTPLGEVRTIDRQLQIPFTFLPKGEVAYNFQGGLAKSDFSSGLTGRQIYHGDIAFGISTWLTGKIGSEYVEGETTDNPMVYGSLSARIFSEYLVNLDIAPSTFYRTTASVIYPSSRNINISYTHFAGPSFYNFRGAEEEISANLYTPFNIFGANMGLRLGGEHTIYSGSTITRYRGDLSFRARRLNFRLIYRDLLFISGDSRSTGQGQATASATFTFQRSPGVPVFVRGMFLRANINYDTFYNDIDRVDLQLSRSIRQTGRLMLSGGYDLRMQQPSVQIGFTIDLNAVRSSTNLDYRNDHYSVRQSFRGSVGFDHNPGRVVLDNRDQVGRAGASVVLFVDNNNSGTYDEGDEIIPHNAVRLDRAAKTNIGSDGILRISQLQSYYRYNLEVNRNALPNPLLVPAKDQFSFVTDPNRYKRIEIPFYRTGIIDGMVYIERNGQMHPQGGLRLLLNGLDTDFSETIRNFSDGGYYAMDLPPGRYTIEVDPSQLAFLNAYQRGGPLNFEIQALSDGDFVENLDIYILPGEAPDEPQPVEPIIEEIPEEPEPTEELPAIEPEPVEEIPVQPEAIIEEPEPVLEEPEPVVETVPEPVVEKVPEEPEPVVEVVPEPIVEIVPEPIVEIVPEEPEPVEVVPEPVVEVVPEEPEPTVPVTEEPVTEIPEVILEEPAEVIPEPAEPIVAEPEPAGTHYLQVGMYATYGLADAARSRAEQVSGQPHYIKLHRGFGLHLVFSGLDNESAITNLEERLRNENFGEGFSREASDITGSSSYHLRLRTFPDRESAMDYISEAGPALGMNLVLDYYESGNRYELRTESFGTLEEAMEAQEMLKGRSDLQPVIVVRD